MSIFRLTIPLETLVLFAFLTWSLPAAAQPDTVELGPLVLSGTESAPPYLNLGELSTRFQIESAMTAEECVALEANLQDFGPWIVALRHFKLDHLGSSCGSRVSEALVDVKTIVLYCNPNAICGGEPAWPVVIPIFRTSGTATSSTQSGESASSENKSTSSSFPYVVMLGETKDEVKCTGTIISQTAILTAAHCVCNTSLSWAFIGTSIFPDDPANKGESAWIELDFTPDYFYWDCNSDEDARREMYDLAVLQLRRELGVDDAFVADIGVREDTGATVVGFGANEFSTKGGTKRFAWIQLSECGFPDNPRDCNGSHEVMATDAEGTHIDTCLGDSGGPILQKSKTVIGVVARGFGDEPCGSGGIYVNFSRYDERLQELVAWLAEF